MKPNFETAAALLEGNVPSSEALTALATAMKVTVPAGVDLPGQAAFLRRCLLIGLIQASAFGATI